jgi:hypothetical protein
MYGFFEAIYPTFLAAIGGFIGAALLLPTKLGEAIIQYRVGKTLEIFKAEQAEKLESLRAKLDHLGDRGKRSNEMEFQAIQAVWRAFVKAWLSTNTCVAQFIKVPDFARMSDDEIESFATGARLEDHEKKSLLEAGNKEKEYSSIVAWRAVIQAETDIYEARLTLREQRIFMPPSITDKFSAAIEQMSGAQVQRRLGLEHPHIKSYEFGQATTEWLKNCTSVFEALAASANDRLFRDEH